MATVSLAGLSGEIDPDGDGTVLIVYYLSASKEKEVNVRVEFSTDGGAAYSSCTEDHSPSIDGGITNTTQGITSLLAGPGGRVHHFAWDTDAPSDIPGQNLNSVRVRITVVGGGTVQTGYLIVTNDGSDVTAPELSTLTATAVQGPSNDTIEFVFNEPVLKGEAEDPTHYIFQHPGVSAFSLPGACHIDYNVLTQTASILLDTATGPNLQYDEDFTVTASGIHDLLGQ